MRLSHLLVGGVVAAAAVAGTSAFTAANDLEDDTVAGYDDTTVTGATVTNIAYNPDATDPSLLASVVFTAADDVTDTASIMQLRSGGSATAAASTCVTGAHDGGTPGTTPITCTLGPAVAFTSFDGIALTVVSQ